MLELLLYWTLNALYWIIPIILGALLFSLAVFIHELGHFLAARLLGMRADVFSIGFGPALWKRTFKGTELRISAIPFGGYVSLPQLDPEGMQKIQGDHSAEGEAPLPPVAPWKRIVVAFAGPFGNILLAVICACAIAWFAPPEATGGTVEVGLVEPGTAADRAQLRPGDQLRAVNGKPTRTWSDFQTECILAGGENATITLTVERDGALLDTQATLDTPLLAGSDAYKIGGLHCAGSYLGIRTLIEGSAADEADVQPGDKILTVNGAPFTALKQLTERPDPTAPMTLQLLGSEPDAQPREVTLTPREMTINETTGEKRWLVGIVADGIAPRSFPWMSESGVGAQLYGDAYNVVRILEALTVPENDGERGRAAKNLGGPLMIFNIFIQMIQFGVWVCLGLLRLICINLAILNLLPIPVLDGGHILFALYAMIFRREPNAKVIAFVTNAFAILLLGVMLLLVGVDITRFFF